jgi:hypothetical protein
MYQHAEKYQTDIAQKMLPVDPQRGSDDPDKEEQREYFKRAANPAG